jgi:ubiquinone/menaquinone biosynthesis C-methylase UbiE
MAAEAKRAEPRARTLTETTRQYDRVARFYKLLEPLFLISPLARRKAVAALAPAPGDQVLEIGAGTGRNLPHLIEAVGPGGKVVALDASPGMLREAEGLVSRKGWANVRFVHQNAARLQLDQSFDRVLFSLSYSAIPPPERAPALAAAWDRLRPGGRLVIMDAGLFHTRFRRLLDPIARLLIKLGPGDPYSRPLEDLAAYGQVAIERFMFGIYYVCSVTKE